MYKRQAAYSAGVRTSHKMARCCISCRACAGVEFACGEGGPGFLPGSAWNEMRLSLIHILDIAGKTRGVPDDCDMLNVARSMGISLG